MSAAQPLAEALGLRVEAGLIGHALAEDAFDDEVHRAQVGQQVTGDLQIGGLGQQFAQLLDRERVGQPTPVLAGAHPHPDVGVAALVTAARARDAAERDALRLAERQGFGQRERCDRLERLGLGGGGNVGAGAVGVHGDVRHLCRVDIAGGEHPVHLALARRCGGGEPRIAGERQFDCGGGELATDIGGVGIAHDAVQQRARGLLGVGVVVVGAGQRPLQFGRFDGQAGLQLSPHQLGLGVDVEAGQHERHRVAEAADAVQRHLQGGRRRLAPHAVDAHPVGAVGRQLDAVHPQRHIGIRVARTGDLVEQLCGDGVDADQAAGPGMLGDHRRSVRVDLGQRESGMREIGASR